MLGPAAHLALVQTGSLRRIDTIQSYAGTDLCRCIQTRVYIVQDRDSDVKWCYDFRCSLSDG
jgi:hypothetical protein